MKRREWFERAGIGVAAFSLPAVIKKLVPSVSAQGRSDDEHGGHGAHHGPSLSGPMAMAVVSFGQWNHNLDRQVLTSPLLPPGGQNQHYVLPYEATIKAGGAVVFAISGNHQVIVYDSSVTALSDLNPSQVVNGLLEYAPGRLYRGPAPAAFGSPAAGFQQDRIETVHFPNAGSYLVVCGRSAHLFPSATDTRPAMHGWVRVLA